MEPNHIFCVDCNVGIPRLEDHSISLVLTSPPYAKQRDGHYDGISEWDYPAFTVSWMGALKPKLTHDASVIVNIRSHVDEGVVSDYVLRTRLAIRAAGYEEPEELIWFKPQSAPIGSIDRPRRAWEHLLWYSPCKNPFVALRAAGKRSKYLFGPGISGFKGCKTNAAVYGPIQQIEYGEGTARVSDVFECAVDNEQVPHPARYPVALCVQLVKTFSPEGGLVCDPFMGSGSTAIACIETGRSYIGFDKKMAYCELAERRIAEFLRKETSIA